MLSILYILVPAALKRGRVPGKQRDLQLLALSLSPECCKHSRGISNSSMVINEITLELKTIQVMTLQVESSEQKKTSGKSARGNQINPPYLLKKSIAKNTFTRATDKKCLKKSQGAKSRFCQPTRWLSNPQPTKHASQNNLQNSKGDMPK